MCPLLRAGRVRAAALAAPRARPPAESVPRMRLWPGDLDCNLHLDDGRFPRLEPCSRVLGRDDQWIFMEQRFVHGEETVALAVVKSVRVGRRGHVPPAEYLAEAGHSLQSPRKPEAVRRGEAAEQGIQAGAATARG